ncbi:MAG: protease SohB, partial [Gemmatimonadales bacterium]
MVDIFMQYGLFLAKAVTIVVAVGTILILGVALSRRRRPTERLEVKSLNRKYEIMAQTMRRGVLSRKDYRKESKTEKARKKAEKKR